jgi:hypothetical protein
MSAYRVKYSQQLSRARMDIPMLLIALISARAAGGLSFRLVSSFMWVK